MVSPPELPRRLLSLRNHRGRHTGRPPGAGAVHLQGMLCCVRPPQTQSMVPGQTPTRGGSIQPWRRIFPPGRFPQWIKRLWIFESSATRHSRGPVISGRVAPVGSLLDMAWSLCGIEAVAGTGWGANWHTPADHWAACPRPWSWEARHLERGVPTSQRFQGTNKGDRRVHHSPTAFDDCEVVC